MFAPFFEKMVIFRKLPVIGIKKHTMIIEQKSRLKTYFYSAKMTLDQLITLIWTSF